MLKEMLKNTCSFMAAFEDKDETGYPRVELFYVRAYHDGSHWWNTVFHIHKDLMIPALVKEVDEVYVAFLGLHSDVHGWPLDLCGRQLCRRSRGV